MSQENVDVVRRAIEAFNRREMWLEDLDPEVEWIEDPRYPDAQTYRGRDGVERSIEKWWETWASVAIRVEEIIDADDRVVIWGVTEARGHDSDVTVSAPFGGVWELRGGMVVRVRVLGGREEALEAAGLSQ
jgi:ketosteroid isomerase-like protein